MHAEGVGSNAQQQGACIGLRPASQASMLVAVEAIQECQVQRCLRICGHSLFQHCDMATRRALRQTCQVARQAVDASVYRLEWDGNASATAVTGPHGSTDDLTSIVERWPGVSKLVCTKWHWITSLRGLPPRLRSLNLRYCLQLADLDAAQCSAAFTEPLVSVADTLRSLKLSFNPLGCAGIHALAAAMRSLQHLTSLKLALGSADLSVVLAQAMGQLTKLQRLYIGSKQMQPAACSALMGSLARLTSLERLSLPANRLHRKGAELAEALTCLTRLSSLSLSHSGLDCTDAQHLAPAIQQLSSTLLELDLSGNDLGTEAALALSTALHSCTALRVLSIGNCNASVGTQPLLLAIQRLRSLEHLDMENMKMGPADAQQLASTLSCLTNLQWLSIGANAFDASSAAPLAAALRGLRGLRRLDASCQPWEGAGMAALLPALQRLPYLDSLVLGECGLDETAAAVIASVGLPCSLTMLDLEANPFGPGGAEHLTAALLNIQPCRLQSLRLAEIGLGGSSAPRLLPMLMALDSLRELYAESNKLTPADEAEVRHLVSGHDIRVVL